MKAMAHIFKKTSSIKLSRLIKLTSLGSHWRHLYFAVLFIFGSGFAFAQTTVSSVSRSATNPNNGSITLTWDITFADPVTGLNSSNFTTPTTGTMGVGTLNIGGSGTAWTASLDITPTTNGSVGLDLDNSTLLVPVVSNVPFVGEVYSIDITDPVFSSVAPAASSSVNNTQVSYTLSEAIASGSITWTRTGGTADGSSPHTQALLGSELSSGAHNNITLTNDPTLVDGTIYTITFNGTDAAGNTASTITQTGVTYDTTDPSISSTSPASSSLVNNTQVSYTLSENAASGTITWTRTGGPADGGSPHTQALSGTELNSGAHNNITLTNDPFLVDGAIYTIDFDATDAAGNTATIVSNTNVSYDFTAPSFSSVAPSSSSSVNNTQVSYTLSEAIASGSITWTRTGGSADGSSPHVQALTGTELNSGAHNNITLTNDPTLVDGTIYTITFNGTDAAGNTASTITRTSVTYDTTDPSITSTSPASSSLVNNTQVSYTLSENAASGTITWTRTGGPADGGSPHTQALSGTELNSGAHNNITLTTNPSLVDGAIYTIDFDATDAAGNTATTVSNTNVSYDFTDPSFSSVAPAASSSVNNTQVSYTLSEAIASGSITWTRTGGSADGSSPHIQALTGTELNSGAHNNITLTNDPTLVDGTIYTITFNGTDAAGNTASTITRTGVTYDTTDPSITSTSPASSSFANSTQVSYTLSENVASGTITWTRTGGTADGGSPHTQALTGSELNSGAHNNITLTNDPSLVDGTIYTIDFDATDAAGNTATTVTKTNVTYDATPPSFSTITATPSSGIAKVGDLVTVTLTSVGAETTLVAGSTITVNGVDRSGTFNHAGAGIYTVTYTVTEGNTDRTSGNLPIHIEVDDAAGNTATVTAFTDSNTLAIDANTPSAPTGLDLASIDDSGYSNSDNYTNVNTGLTVSGPAGSAEAGSTVQLYDGGSPVIGATDVAAGDGSWSIDISLTEAAHTITARATDAAGNQSSSSGGLGITVDLTAPSTPSIPDLASGSDSGAANNDDLTNDTSPNFTGSATAGIRINIYSDQDGLVGTGSFGTYDVGTTLTTEGNHLISAQAEDEAGNTSANSANLSIELDTQPPTVTGMTFYDNGSGREDIYVDLSEPINLADGAIPDLGNPGWEVDGTTSDFDLGGMAYTEYQASYSRLRLHSDNNGDWLITAIVEYNPGGGDMLDLAGNEMVYFSGNPSDNDPPVLLSGLVFYPNGTGAETIVFQTNEEINIAENGDVTGFSTSTGSIFSAKYTSKGTYNYITLTSGGNGQWTDAVTLSYTQGTASPVKDASNNELAAFAGKQIQLTGVSIASNNANGDNQAAIPGEDVTLSFTATTALTETPIVTIDGVSATVNTSLAPTYSATISTTTGNNTGSMPFLISVKTASDSTGVDATTNSSVVVFDKTLPNLNTNVTIYSNNGANPTTHATTGNTVTIDFTSNEELFFDQTPIINPTPTPSVVIGGRTATVVQNTITTYTATLVLNGTEPEGALAFTIDYEDAPGNSGVQRTTTTDGTSIIFDKTPPTVSSVVVDPGSTFTGIGTTNGILASNTMNFIVTFSEPVDGVAATDFAVNLDPNTIAGATVSNSGLTLTGGVDGDTQYTLRLDGVTGTGQVRLDYNTNSATIYDNAGQNTNNAPQVGELFTVVSKQPSAQVTGIGTQNITQSQIELTWTEGTPVDPPTHYLLVVHGPTGSFPSIADGDNSLIDTNDTDFSGDDIVIISVPAGTSSFVFDEGGSVTGLQAGSQYDFEIYSYTLAPGATTDNVDFNTSSAPTTSATMPTAALTTITNGSGPATISSLNTTTADWTPVFSFDINDDSNFSLNNNPPYDNVPTKFSQIVINQLNPVTGTNTITNWDQVIAAARLIDDEGNVQEANVTVNATNITIANIASEVTTDLGWVDDNETKKYTLEIYLKSDMSGSENYPDNIDNLNFHFEVNQASFTYDNTPGSGSTFNGVQSQNSGNGNNVIEVLPTQLVFSTQPDANVGVSGVFPTTPVVTARDANGNLDNDFNSSVTVTSTNGAINVQNAPTAFPTGPTTGILTFPANFGLDATGVTKIQVASASPALLVQSNNVNVSYSDGSELSFNSGNASISSLADSEPEKVNVFSFHLEDDATPSIVDDGIGTLVNQIVITQGTNNDVADWTHAIAGAKLFDGSTEITGTVNSTNITFSSIPNGTGQFGEIIDDGSKDFTLRIWLKSTIDPSISGSIDGSNLVFKVDESGIGLIANSSDLSNAPATSAETIDTDNEIEVIATQLKFTTQPPAEALVNADLSTSPVLEAFDVNNNRDRDYNSPITVTNAKTLGMSNAPASISSGLLNFASNFQYTDIGDGSAGNGTLTITASALAANGMVPTSTISTDVFVRVGASTLITAGATSEPTTFSSANDTNPGSFVFDFTVTDDAGTEDDGNPTLISSLVITQGATFNNAALSDWTQVIEGAVLYDDELIPNSITGAISTNSITFSTIPTGIGQLGYIGDDAAKVYELHIWLKDSIDFRISGFTLPMASYTEPTVTVDNKKLEFEVDEINITTVPTGSSFKSGEMLTSGNANQIDVSATTIDFTIEPPISSSVNTPYNVRTEARDANNNRDVDFTHNLDNDVTNQGGLAMLNAPTTTDSFTAGVFDFNANFQYDESGSSPAGKLTLQANGLVTTSQDIEVIASFDSYVTADNAGLSTSINPISFDAGDIINDGTTDVEIARFILHDGKAPAPGMDDVDGATTNLTDLDIDIIGYTNLKRIALYAEDIDGNGDGMGTYTEIDEQSAAATINFEDIITGLFHAVDNKTRTFIIVASFQDTYVDNNPVQVTITNVEARLGGSQFDVAEPLPFTDPAKNIIEVTADKLDFDSTPLDAVQGINIPITPSQPKVFANDAKGNLDVDFVETVTVSSSGAGLGTLPTAFSGGVLNFPGFTYTSPGDGTLTVDAFGGLTQNSNAVDVIETTISTLDLGNGVTINNNGIEAASDIIAGGFNKAILGFKISAVSGTTNEPVLNDITIQFGNPIGSSLENIRLVSSIDENFSFPESTVINTTIVGSDYITFQAIDVEVPDNASALNYFVIANIKKTANFSTPKIHPTLIISGIPTGDVVLSSGSINADVDGRTYGFDDINKPTVETLFPANGEENFDKDSNISIEFNESVIPMDSLIHVYSLAADTLVATLKLDPLLTSVDSTTFYFDPQSPVVGSALQGDTDYYINIETGDLGAQIGFKDKSDNTFDGISGNSEWVFKTKDNIPPVFVGYDAENIIDIGFDLRVALDEAGQVNYIIVPGPAGAIPTRKQIVGPNPGDLYPGTIVADSLDIIQGNELHYVSVFDEGLFTPSGTYTIWLTGHDVAFNIMTDDPIPIEVTLDASIPGTDPVIRNTPSNTPINVCIGDYQNIFAPISIIEVEDNDFTSGTNQTINFILPSEYAYKTDNVTVQGQGGDISNVSFNFISNSILTIKFDINSTSNRDKIVIGGIVVKALGDENTVGAITRLGGTGIPTIQDGDTLVRLNTYQIPQVIFTTDPPTSAIGNANEEVLLKPDLTPLDKGNRVFSGPGVFGNIMYTSAAGLGTHTITFNYTNEVGCTSEYSLTRTIFDSNEAIVGLNQTYCTDDTDVIVPYDGRSPEFLLVDLKVEVAPEQPDGVDSVSMVDPPFETDVLASLTPDGNDFRFIPNVFKIVENYDKFTNNVAGTNEGGLIGELLFTGVYQNQQNTSLFDTLEQRVEVYFSPTAEINIGGYGDIGDNTFDANNITPTTTAPIELEFCEDEGEIPLQGSSPNGYFAISIPYLFSNDSIGFPGLTDNGDGTGSLNPQTMVDNGNFSFGEAIVKFIVDAPGGGCSNTVAQTIRIHPRPRANFAVPAIICEDTPIIFNDATGYLKADVDLVNGSVNNAVLPAVTSWQWNFNDEANSTGDNPNTKTGSDPAHEFEDPGLYDVSLSIVNEFGCAADTTIQQIIGGIPTATYDFGGTSVDEPITFQSSSILVKSSAALDQSIDRVQWDVDGDNIFDIDEDDMDPVNNNVNPYTYNYTNPGVYNVTFVATATTGCSDTLTNQIAILPNKTIAADGTYSESFESDDGGWISLPELNSTDNSWAWGAPSKSTIVPDTGQGSNVWITDLNVPYVSGERSYVYSPAINFTALERPMLQFDIFRDLESQDGVILEYSTDSLNILDPNKQWVSLGSTVNEGVDWFNAVGLAGNPGKNNTTGLGWEGHSGDWVKAKHDLEDTYASGTTQAEKDLIKSRIIFRIGLGAISGDKTGNDGFAFDNFLMGNRTRTVLLENFTSSQQVNFTKDENDAINDFQIAHPSMAVIQYHVNVDGQDPLSNSPAGDARALYYGIGTTPRVALDGIADPNQRFTQWAINAYGIQALDIAQADIQTVLQSNGSKIDIISTITAVADIPKNYIVHMVIVKNHMNTTTTDSGETDFYNVVQRMLPNSAGRKFADPLLTGETRIITNTWSSSETFDPADYTVIVFIQNESSGEIYQAEVVAPTIGIITGIEDDLKTGDLAVYPNPAHNSFTLQLSKFVNHNTEVNVFNQVGQIIYTTQLASGEDRVIINTADWVPSIYYLQTELDEGLVRQRIIIQHR